MEVPAQPAGLPEGDEPGGDPDRSPVSSPIATTSACIRRDVSSTIRLMSWGLPRYRSRSTKKNRIPVPGCSVTLRITTVSAAMSSRLGSGPV